MPSIQANYEQSFAYNVAKTGCIARGIVAYAYYGVSNVVMTRCILESANTVTLVFKNLGSATANITAINLSVIYEVTG